MAEATGGVRAAGFVPAEPTIDPIELYRLRDGIYATDLLIAGICWLDLFSWLDEQPSDLASICRGLQLAMRPADVMLTLFAALGLVQQQHGTFHVTPLAREHLVRTSPSFLGPYFAALKDRAVCTDILAVLRSGKPASWCSQPNDDAWSDKMGDADFARSFTAAMDARAAFLAPALARAIAPGSRRRLLDIAGASGIYACTIIGQYPQLTATVFEKPPVDAVARQLIGERGFAERVNVMTGDMFAVPLPAGYDIHLISNVLHDWDVADVRRLLQRSFAALDAGGLMVIHDAHLNRDKCGPLAVAMYSVLLMHSTEGRCYSIGEMEEFLRECGCVEVQHAATAADRSVVMGTKE